MKWMLVLAMATLGSGCGNPCQQICPRMAAYARDCGYEVSSDEVQACISEQSGDLSAQDREVCREFGGKQEIRDQWTCDDIAAYFGRSAESDTGSLDLGRVE